jgi:hypothetical protein
LGGIHRVTVGVRTDFDLLDRSNLIGHSAKSDVNE